MHDELISVCFCRLGNCVVPLMMSCSRHESQCGLGDKSVVAPPSNLRIIVAPLIEYEHARNFVPPRLSRKFCFSLYEGIIKFRLYLSNLYVAAAIFGSVLRVLGPALRAPQSASHGSGNLFELETGSLSFTKVTLITSVPLSRGLKSSAAAIVGGVMLGNEAPDIGLSRERMSDYCLMVECHPNNIAPALFGDFIGAFMDTARIKIPLSEVLNKFSEDTDISPRLIELFLLLI